MKYRTILKTLHCEQKISQIQRKIIVNCHRQVHRLSLNQQLLITKNIVIMKTFFAGGHQYKLHSLTGKIIKIGKERVAEGIQEGTITYGRPGIVYKIYDRILLMDSSGKEHDIILTDFDINSRAGHEVTLLWAIKNGTDWGPYIAVKVHDTDSYYYLNQTLSNMYTPSSFPGILVLIGLFAVSVYFSGFWIATLVCLGTFLFLNFFVYMKIINSGVKKFKSLAWA